ncbi:alpha/beta hydrolase [Streptomyces sp. NPDC005774]|uniref:alpha/beta hydrolase n=1 Tax=Streptomyces sp. NPDC005774 TaxID=3364728 RepID=UPI003689CC19
MLSFDRRGPGQAPVTEILGDLAHADRVAVLVPGSDASGLDASGRFHRGAEGARAGRPAPCGPSPARSTGNRSTAWCRSVAPGTPGTGVRAGLAWPCGPCPFRDGRISGAKQYRAVPFG